MSDQSAFTCCLGRGVCGFVFIGALLQCEGFEVASVSTCSAGTFVGALCCCGVRPDAMR